MKSMVIIAYLSANVDIDSFPLNENLHYVQMPMKSS